MDELSNDLRHAARALRRDGRFTVLAVLTLGIGIGLNAGVFTVFHAVLLTPPPYPDPERLVVLWSEIPSADIREGTSSYANVQDWKARTTAFEDLATWDPTTRTSTAGDAPERLEAVRMSSNLFDVLGVAPTVGRAFTSAEAEAAEPLVVASHAFASARFGDASAALGRTVVLDGISFEIIGVMPPDFGYPGADTRLWIPYTHFPNGEAEAVRRGTGAWRVIGRLRREAAIETARADLGGIAAALEEEHSENAGLAIRAVPLHEQQTGESRRATLWILYGAVGLVLLIACANAAHLIQIRSVEQSGDRAIRTALGASRMRLVRQALAEHLLIALLAGIVGVGLAVSGVELLVTVASPDVLRADVHIGLPTLGYIAGLAALIGTVFGVAPIFGRPAARLDLAGARVLSSGPGRRKRRDALIAAQLALALVLVFSASLLVRSLVAAAAVDPGFEPDGVLLTNLSVPSPEARASFYTGAVESLSGVAGVQAAGIIEDIFIGGAPNLEIMPEGGSVTRPIRIPVRVDAIGGDLFEAIGVPLVAGRLFTAADGASAPPVAIVNEWMAQRLWPGASPIGRRFRAGDPASDAPWLEIVGVVGDMRRQGVELEPIAQVFRPQEQAPSRNMNLLVRSDVPPDALAALLRQRLAALDRTIPLYGVTTLTAGMDRYVAQRRVQTFLLGLFSSVALVMAAVGIYGLLHYSVSRRAQEIGVRVALGARSADVVRMVLGEAFMLAAPGIAIGLLAALWVAELLAGLLYAVGPSDPVSLAATAITLTSITLLASYLPARRAAAVDPNRALRGD